MERTSQTGGRLWRAGTDKTQVKLWNAWRKNQVLHQIVWLFAGRGCMHLDG